MNLNKEEMEELFELLSVASGDATALIRLSHDREEIKAYKEHRFKIAQWLKRLELAREQKAYADDEYPCLNEQIIQAWAELQAVPSYVERIKRNPDEV